MVYNKARDGSLHVLKNNLPQIIDNNALQTRSENILNLLLQPHENIEFIQQQIKQICSTKLPLLTLNNNYWAKLMKKMNDYNPNLNGEAIEKFFNLDYKNFIEITLNQYNRQEIK
jgi:hypothetical protein